ncbi:helix-turn-helix domain-containing protein [Protofrankia coriariae]|uniref:helix-turn-helix domain-containing protein n=1 Tax=Protofrankia coriariae TaxID=1562887 RepID=UPI001F395D7C|nr:helix-turn-helix transcriptional regulator [Protofrankia coriariae]
MPDHFWQTDELRDALASWHIGRVVAAYRRNPWHGRVLSQELVGGWVGISQVQLSRIESGPPIKDLDRLVMWARTLRIPGRFLWFQLPEQRSEPVESAPAAAAVPVGPDLPALLGSLTSGRLPLAAGERRTPTIGISAFDGMTNGQSAELLLKLFLQLDDELGGDSLYLPLSRYVARMAVTVEQDSGDGLVPFGQLSQMAGWLALDADHHGTARRYFTTTIYVAHEGDEPGLAASALAYMSLQETYRGRRGPALSLAQTALASGTTNLTPLTRTMLGTRLARAQAGVGDQDGCLRSLDTARADFERAGHRDEPLWVSYVDEVEVAAQEGACFLELGLTTEASTALTEAIDLLTRRAPYRVRDRVHYLSRLAKCQLLAGNVEQACQTAGNALEVSEAIGSTRVALRLKEFADGLAPFGAVPAARDFAERFRLATT